jgi:hypothetical protein
MSRSSQIRILEHKAEQRLIAVNIADGVLRGMIEWVPGEEPDIAGPAVSALSFGRAPADSGNEQRSGEQARRHRHPAGQRRHRDLTDFGRHRGSREWDAWKWQGAAGLIAGRAGIIAAGG